MADKAKILKTEDELQIVWGVVYFPGMPDAHGHFMTAEEIRKSCYDFMARGDLKAVDIMHDNIRYGCFVVENFIVREGDVDFAIPGSWVAGVHIPDKTIWGLIKDGTLNGFSMEALAVQSEATFEANFPAYAQGRTEVADGHSHEFEVMYNEAGEFAGGRTDFHTDEAGNSHFHVIKRGVMTEDADGHHHNFAMIDKIIEAAGV